MPKGCLAIVLHAHLPFVRHPEYEDFLEERWFFEAVTETYIPLIKFLERLARENTPIGLTLSLSPTLLAMLEDPMLQERYRRHLAKLIELSEKELDRNRDHPHLHWLSGMYRTLFLEAWGIFDACAGRLCTAFQRLERQGAIDLITTAATHGFLPLLALQPKMAEAQIACGLEYFEAVFGHRPEGIWLPECAWCPGLDEVLRDQEVRYFFVETHGLEHASVRPLHGVHAPLYTPSGVAAFGRDQGSTKQVWSAKDGFPGDPEDREFYRDIGHDLDFQYIRPYLPGGTRADTGIKYHRITGPTPWKELYHPDRAREKAALHAGEFLRKRMAHIEYLASLMDTLPMIVAPFDAELFGHWWFEGPQWLDFLIRKTVFDQDVVQLSTPRQYLDRHPIHQRAVPATSSWGHKGYFETWLNGKTDWIHTRLIECGDLMRTLASHFGRREVSGLVERALNQCARELLLAQSSDWPFMVTTGSAEQYATRRVKDHVNRFHYLADGLARGVINEEYLAALEAIDNIFPRVDYRRYTPAATVPDPSRQNPSGQKSSLREKWTKAVEENQSICHF